MMHTAKDSISVVIPALNEVASLPRLFASLEQQTLRPREIIVVDAGSSDGTQALVRAYAEKSEIAVRLIEAQDSRPGKSRNIGTRAAAHEIVACSDAGVRLDVDWLRHLTQSLRNGSHEVAVGSFAPDGTNLFEKLVGLLLIRPPKKVNVLYAGGVSIAFTRSALERVGGYPEDVYPCEDALFLRKVVEAGIEVERAHEARSLWRPRSSVAALWRQYRSYAWGDAQIGLGARRHALRAAFWIACLAASFGIAGSIGRILGLAALAAYLLRPTIAAFRATADVRSFFLGPLILATKDWAQLFGYLEGRVHRARGGGRDFTKRAVSRT